MVLVRREVDGRNILAIDPAVASTAYFLLPLAFTQLSSSQLDLSAIMPLGVGGALSMASRHWGACSLQCHVTGGRALYTSSLPSIF